MKRTSKSKGSGANRKALDSFNVEFSRYKPITMRQNKYLNNRIKQHHRTVQRRSRPILGFKSFRYVRILLAGIELMLMFRKGQFKIDDKVPLSLRYNTMPLLPENRDRLRLFVDSCR